MNVAVPPSIVGSVSGLVTQATDPTQIVPKIVVAFRIAAATSKTFGVEPEGAVKLASSTTVIEAFSLRYVTAFK